MKRSLSNLIVFIVTAMLVGCGGGGGGDGGDDNAGAVCEQVSQGNSTVKVINSSNSMINVYFGELAFGADIDSGLCNLVGIEIPSNYTLDMQVEINQCTPDPKGGCGAYYGTTKYVPLTLNQGEEKTITIGSDFFN